MKPKEERSVEQKLDALVAEIVSVITTTNFEISRIELAPGSNLEKATSNIVQDIDHNLHLLNAKARLGDDVAISAIHSIGLAAATQLDELNSSSEDRQRQFDHFPPQFRIPAISLFSNTRPVRILDIIQREETFIRSLTPEQIRSAFKTRVIDDFDMQFTCLDIELNTPVHKQAADGPERSSQEAEGTFNHRTEEQIRRSACVTTFAHMVNRTVESIFLQTIRDGVSRKVISHAGKSLEWPVVGMAWQETWKKLPDKIKSLGLGVGLPFRVGRKSDRGNARRFDEDSSTLFLLSLCCRLSEAQALHPDLDQLTLSNLSRIDQELENDRKALPGKEDVRKAAIRNSYPSILGDEQHTWNLESHWNLKALLLPPFPKTSAATIMADLILWKRALFLLAECICEGDWGAYPWWPLAVTQRTSHTRKEGNRTARDGVYDLIEHGIRNLLKD